MPIVRLSGSNGASVRPSVVCSRLLILRRLTPVTPLTARFRPLASASSIFLHPRRMRPSVRLSQPACSSLPISSFPALGCRPTTKVKVRCVVQPSLRLLVRSTTPQPSFSFHLPYLCSPPATASAILIGDHQASLFCFIKSSMVLHPPIFPQSSHQHPGIQL